jgi:hypothetical protein
MTFERKTVMHEQFDYKGKLKYSQPLTGNENIIVRGSPRCDLFLYRLKF